ncbi:MAG: LamG-like jellyroll fold domain-containing protein, partial [Planctomycetota bacterium]|nr:LamG-like jellyroll fold domain-containing protein [Planctomycetota bacterium]
GYVDCGYQASFDLSTGVVLEAWVRHNRRPALRQAFKSETTSGRRSLRGKSAGGGLEPAYSIVEKKGSWFLGMTPEGALEGHIGDFQVITEDDVVPSGRWVFVSLRYDGVSLVLASDGVERRSDVLQSLGRKLGDRAAPVVPAAIPRNENPVMISAKDNSFPGDIDEVRLRGRSEKATYSHPPFEKLIGWKKVIHFDRYGHLDPVFHEKNIRIVLVEVSDDHFALQETLAAKKKSSRAQTDRFELTFQEWLETWPPDEMPDLVEEEEERDIEERVYSQARKKVIKIDTLGVVSVQ